jgi:crotonobetainyl-CoA:carnitine CoA-transferase CaiB-like acyl-CoA transferase
MLLGDLGADVIKVESPQGDETRHWGPPWAGEGAARQSAYYLAVNRNKRSISLNLKQPEAQRVARDLAARSHIVIENFRPGQMARFGLGYDDLRAASPALVYASITGFGQTGPYRDRPGYDHVIQAMSGLMAITGPPEGDGYKVGVAVVDVFSGLFALSSVLAALRHAERTGQGRHIDIALMDAQLSALVNVASAALISGSTAARYGNAHSTIVPYQNFNAADGPFALAVGNDGQFAALCTLLGRPDLLADQRFATNPARVVNRAALVAALSAIFVTHPAAHWVELCLAAGIPAGPVQTVTQALSDEHAAAHHLIRETTLADGTVIPTVASPLLPDTPDAIRYPPPALGQHTSAVLSEILGLSADEIAALKSSGAI